MQLKDRTFIVSGGSSGLGLATTSLLVQQGAYVSVLDLNPPPSDSQLNTSRVLFTKTNVASTESIQTALQNTLRWIKDQTSAPMSGVICSAGIGTAALSLPKQDPVATHETVKYMDMSGFDRTLTINLRGTVDLIRLTVPHLALNEPWGPDGERGVIVVVASVAAYEGQVGQLAYSASKGAVRSIVLPLARELGQKAGIRVMGIAPGVFQTGMTTPPQKKPTSGGGQQATKKEGAKKEKDPTGARATMNTEMIQYPTRMGQGHEFARLVKEIVENPMLNGFVIRLDGAVRMPSRL
ncbi:hypothetical protein H2200_000236 [Cladophialophora chaetospira]|uniref:3-hydroxyacyl-CoA dehydrogenase type-2 n=1 Tax=Cladophialophora chaetospira TaxID=386627 RepID=A0AA38XN65_9EURO|nr:hypothetical protein H2200_000236 [Cladophialophora chaetospira]